MNQLNENILKAQQTADFLTRDLEAAYSEAAGIARMPRPEGPSHADNALSAYLAERVAEARQLQSKLLSL